MSSVNGLSTFDDPPTWSEHQPHPHRHQQSRLVQPGGSDHPLGGLVGSGVDVMADDNHHQTTTASAPPRPARILACHQCQQRKIKCNRSFPCTNCTKARLHCVPATLTARRRRRHFPETELLDRIRKYEELLRRNDINFDAIDNAIVESHSPRAGSRTGRAGGSPSSHRSEIPSPAHSDITHEPKYVPSHDALPQAYSRR